MRVLFIGGTGIISTACTRLAAERDIELTLLTRGQRQISLPAGVRTLVADIEDEAATAALLQDRQFDAVVDWIAFTPGQAERDVRLFRGRTRQFIFISTASAYQKPPSHYLITESTPLCNPHWDYSRKKIACEELLLKAYREEGFPMTIVRPSLTYGETQVALILNSWQKSYTIIGRLRRGQPVIVPGDGSSLWTITHNSDFAKGLVGLLGHQQSIGHAFHITSDEVMTWNQYFRVAAHVAGAPEPKLVHIPSDFLVRCNPDWEGSLLGDKSVSGVFDNSKIKRFVPGFCATVPFAEGLRRTLAWFDADPARQQIDTEAEAAWDRILDAWEYGAGAALERLRAARP